MNAETKSDRPMYYCGKRYLDSLRMHKNYSNLPAANSVEGINSYFFKLPPKQNVIDALNLSNKLARQQKKMESGIQLFVGNNPLLVEPTIEDAAWKFNTDRAYANDSSKLTYQGLK